MRGARADRILLGLPLARADKRRRSRPTQGRRSRGGQKAAARVANGGDWPAARAPGLGEQTNQTSKPPRQANPNEQTNLREQRRDQRRVEQLGPVHPEVERVRACRDGVWRVEGLEAFSMTEISFTNEISVTKHRKSRRDIVLNKNALMLIKYNNRRQPQTFPVISPYVDIR